MLTSETDVYRAVQRWRSARVCLLYGVSLRVGCVECYTATEGAVCVFCWKTEDLLCLNRVNTALDEWHSVT